MRRSHARFLHPCYPPVRPAARRAGTVVAHRPGMVPDTGRRGCARASVRLVFSLSLWLCAARPAAAMRACGDDVDGHGKAVPCACGDLLVSSRALGAADRITREPCPGMGLLVAAPGPVTLAFTGRTIRGDGQGIGVLVVRGTL